MESKEKILGALKSWKLGDQLFDTGDYHGSILNYENAIKLSKIIPTEELFDHGGFQASCYAGLSGSLGKLGKHTESLKAAENALIFFEKYGDMYPAETGKWMMAIVNRGSALAMLGKYSDALLAFSYAKKKLNSYGMNTKENRQWIIIVSQNIYFVKKQLQIDKRKNFSWWKFWKWINVPIFII